MTPDLSKYVMLSDGINASTRRLSEFSDEALDKLSHLIDVELRERAFSKQQELKSGTDERPDINKM